MIRMLIVDDEPLVLLTIRSLCDWEEQGIRIVGEARDGKTALAFLKACPDIDIVIVDVDMPVMNGLEFAEALGQEEQSPAVIFLSSYSNFEYVRTAFKSGACEYILKSELEAKSLLNIIRRIPPERMPNRKAADGTGVAGTEQCRQAFFSRLLGGCLLGEPPDGEGSGTVPDRGAGAAEAQDIVSLFAGCGFTQSFPFSFMILRPGDLLLVHERYANKLYDFQKTVTDLLTHCISGNTGDCGALSYDKYYIFMKDRGEMEARFERFYRAAWTYIDVGFEGKTGAEAADLAALGREFSRCLRNFMPPSRLVTRSRRYIREHYNDPDLNLSRIAEFNQVSKNHLSFEFARETGETIVEFITRTRIREAKKLLRETNLRVYEIAEKTGYLNTETFTRIFKRVTGKSPSHFL
ncbi:MAG: response regulator [Treponema sp.]|jgi:two-component system response regulator YesN|nr:response regulator [Treponema sp.]